MIFIAAGLVFGVFYAKDRLFPNTEADTAAMERMRDTPSTPEQSKPGNSSANSAGGATSQQPSTSAQPPHPAGPNQSAGATRPPGVTRVVCPSCTGEGSIKTRRAGGGLELKQSCAVCMAKGYRDVAVGNGRKLCPDCRGMGSVAIRGSSTAQKTTCSRCSATGTVPAVAK
jgi:DnaJ-class molecular chaperone